MFTRTSWLAVVLSVALAGCADSQFMRPISHRDGMYAAQPKAESKLECKEGGPACEVTVTVSCSEACATSVNANLVVVYKGTDGRRPVIKWSLEAPAGYDFAADGIAVYADDSRPSPDFHCQATQKGHFQCEDAHAAFGVFKYKVTITGANPPPPLDPWIINQG